MADCQDRVVAVLNFLTGEGIAYHPDSCDEETLALINDYFSTPNTKDESGSSDSEGLFGFSSGILNGSQHFQ